LDEQLIEAGHISKKNSENGKLGGRPKATPPLQKKATAKRPLSDRKANESQIELKENRIKVELKENREYTRPRDFLKAYNEMEFEQIEMKAGLNGEFESCTEQWSLKVESSDFVYSEKKDEDYRKLKAGFQKWINSWKSNNSKEKSSGKKENLDRKSIASHLLINQIAKDGVTD